jgi:TolB-like protein/Tfp pilus assembly protein PilF
VIAVAAGLVWRPWRASLPNAPGRVSSLIVLPFDDPSRNGKEDYFAEGMTDALITDLSRIPTLTVISRTSAMRYKALGKSSREIADELHVGAIVDGTVLRSDGQVRISVRLVDAATDRNLWGRDYTRDLKDVLALQGEVARAIASEIRASFAPIDEARLTNTRPIDPPAHEEYLKGRHHWNRRTAEGLTQAITHFRRALDLQPDYAPAHAGLAQCFVLLPAFPLAAMSPVEAFPLALEAAERAIAIDDRLAEAHAALAYARLHLRDVAAAEAGFRRALALNPDATTHFWYAVALAASGRFDEAIDQARQGAALDPVSPIVTTGVAWMHHLARRFDLEIDTAREALALDPNFMMARYRLGEGYLHQGRYDAALVELEKARVLSGGSTDLLSVVGYAHGRAGHRREALAALRAIDDLAASGRQYVSPYALALMHTGLGNRDEAIAWLGRALDQHAWGAVLLAVEPDLDPLRSDPRFADLVARSRR